MADSVTTQVLIDGSRLLSLKLTNISDGSGESAVVKVDASAYGCSAFRVLKIQFNVQGMNVNLLWDASAPVLLAVLTDEGVLDFEAVGGLPNNAGDGKTGDIKLTTVGHTSGDSYMILLDLVKVD